jgi:hypothetical protein
MRVRVASTIGRVSYVTNGRTVTSLLASGFMFQRGCGGCSGSRGSLLSHLNPPLQEQKAIALGLREESFSAAGTIGQVRCIRRIRVET